MVTGDDFGNVNLFNYPCIAKNAPHRSFSGHSSHVMNVKFLSNNESNINDDFNIINRNNKNSHRRSKYENENENRNCNENQSKNEDRIMTVGGNDCSIMSYTVSRISK